MYHVADGCPASDYSFVRLHHVTRSLRPRPVREAINPTSPREWICPVLGPSAIQLALLPDLSSRSMQAPDDLILPPAPTRLFSLPVRRYLRRRTGREKDSLGGPGR